MRSRSRLPGPIEIIQGVMRGGRSRLVLFEGTEGTLAVRVELEFKLDLKHERP